jgi:glycosyltransferase involved in cell wall biosynthesis
VLSIIISSYNHEHFLDETLTSALRLGQKVEILCTDDGSKDDSRRILERYSNRFHNISFLPGPETNIGFSQRVQLFRDVVKTKYCMILNSDDRLIPVGVELALKKLETFKGDFFTASISFIDDNGDSIGYLNGPFQPQFTLPKKSTEVLKGFGSGHIPQSAIYLLATQNWVRSSSNLIMRSDVFWETGGILDYHYASDWALALRLFATKRGLYSVTPFINYRSHNTNTISEDTNQAAHEVKEIFQDFLKEFPEFERDLVFQEMISCNPYLK